MRKWWRGNKRRIISFLHRGKHGWAPEDTWNLDHYLARVMGESLAHLAKYGHGYPTGVTVEEWNTMLNRWSEKFVSYDTWDCNVSDGINGIDRSRAVTEALVEMAPWFGALWD